MDHLPPDLDFDTNAATIRQLLGQHSGIPDHYPAVRKKLSNDLQHAWTPAELLRDGVLRVDGTERLIYQPDEVPTEPMAMPYGESTDVPEEGCGYLPSLAHVT